MIDKNKINKQLRLAILSTKCQEKGFATVVSLGIGLIAIAVGMTMIGRSQSSQISSSSQVKTAKAGAIAEAGITRTAANLNKAKKLLLVNSNQWSSQTIPPPPNSCNPNPTPAANIVPLTGTFDQVIDASYTLLNYTYDSVNSKGTMLIEGQIGSTNPAKKRLEVTFPISMNPSPAPTFASVMANNINIQQSDVTGNITCTNPVLCQITCTSGATSPTTAQLRAAIGASGNAELFNYTDPFNPINKIPSVINVASIEIPNIPAASSGAIVHNLGNVTSNITLNLGTTYQVSPDGNYYFQIGKIDKSAVLINNMPTSDTAKVIFYVSGDIDQAGNDDIRPSSGAPKPGQIRIYGGFANGTMPSSQTFLLSGNACVMAFIHAPKADVGIKGGGNGCSTLPNPMKGTNIYGGVWANSYNVVGNPSNSSVFYEQPGLMTVLAGENPNGALTPSLNSLSSWTTKPAE